MRGRHTRLPQLLSRSAFTLRQHIMEEPEIACAPVFRPTWKEFQDPMGYIASIEPEAAQAGICRIVPPDGWRPPYCIDEAKFRFRTRCASHRATAPCPARTEMMCSRHHRSVQSLATLDCEARARQNFIALLRLFWVRSAASSRRHAPADASTPIAQFAAGQPCFGELVPFLESRVDLRALMLSVIRSDPYPASVLDAPLPCLRRAHPAVHPQPREWERLAANGACTVLGASVSASDLRELYSVLLAPLLQYNLLRSRAEAPGAEDGEAVTDTSSSPWAEQLAACPCFWKCAHARCSLYPWLLYFLFRCLCLPRRCHGCPGCPGYHCPS